MYTLMVRETDDLKIGYLRLRSKNIKFCPLTILNVLLRYYDFNDAVNLIITIDCLI